MNNIIAQKFSLVLICIIFILLGSDIEQLKANAQKEYISGNYIQSNIYFSDICIHINSDYNTKKYAYKMKALLMEQYLGDIDSAIFIYNFYRDHFCQTPREIKIADQKLDFLQSLGDKSKIYGEYQKIIFTNSNDLNRTRSLDQFLKENPSFFKRKEALKQCAIAALNSNQFKIANKAYKNIKHEYSPLSETELTQYNLSKRMYYRYTLFNMTILIWSITLILIIFELLKILKHKYQNIRYPVPSLFIWLILLTLFILIYAFRIYHSDHNPFRISDILFMSIFFTISIFFNGFINLNSKNTLYRIFITVLTTFTIIGAAYYTTYKRPDKITVMEDLYDQVEDIFLKGPNSEKGKNSEN